MSTTKADTRLSIRINSDIKQQAENVFADLGLDISAAINVFLRQAIYFGGFPFDVRLEQPNEITLAAFEEGERMLQDPNARRFSSVDELFAELNDEI